ncbi:MAG: NAD-dependent protein deacylase [Alphaproteobacteria bacterium]|nr:NAD-dependent protein deacylase [Alphaproteobacteria bacterium]
MSIELATAAQWFEEAERALIITGAGVSADSGLPTYRGIGGLYNRPTDEGMPIEEALSGRTFRRDPALSWKYMAQIGRATAGAQPNEAHRVIAALESRVPELIVLTQNVDGLHRAAGSSHVIEIHGGLGRLFCTECGAEHPTPDFRKADDIELPPRCARCGGVVRPDVVLFGETLPDAAVKALSKAMSKPFDLTVIVGTTAVFPYIAEPVLHAARRGERTLEINPGRSEVSEAVALKLDMGAAEAFRGIAAHMRL